MEQISINEQETVLTTTIFGKESRHLFVVTTSDVDDCKNCSFKSFMCTTGFMKCTPEQRKDRAGGYWKLIQ